MSDSSSPAEVTADRLATAVGEVPGVEEIYPTRTVTEALRQVVGAVLAKPGAPTLVQLTETPDGLSASVAIGVSSGAAATEVSRQVYDTIEEQLTATGVSAVADIQVRVSRIG